MIALRLLSALHALFVFTPAALGGQTWIVDDDGGAGVHFTDLPPAIAAAGAGDTLLVQDGNYSSFSLTKPLKIVGYGTVDARVTPDPVFLAGIPPGETAIIDNVTMNALQIYGCFGTVVLRDCVGRELSILLADDVRMHGCDFKASSGTYTGVSVMSSRLEVVESKARGTASSPSYCNPGLRPNGLAVGSQGRVHAVGLTSTGAQGVDIGQLCGGSAGNGGHGATIDTTSALIAVGGTYQGGHGGYHNGSGIFFSGCKSGLPGNGIEACSSGGTGLVRHSGLTASGGGSEFSNCSWYWAADICASNQVQPADGDPKLLLFGSTEAGSVVRFKVYGPPGADALLYLGRKPKVISEPGVEIELLTPMSVTWPLGTIPPEGVLTRNYTIRPLKPGFTFYSQAELTLAGGEVRRTNSLPIIVR
jgi:hypothetical protein